MKLTVGVLKEVSDIINCEYLTLHKRLTAKELLEIIRFALETDGQDT